jgi:N-acetylglucosamine kinase-like BadF-type ATPase
MDFILGVDAGNTKTVAVIATTDGTICGYGRSGCGDIYGASSPEQALSAVREAVQMALDMGGAEATNLLASGFSMAGADWPEDFTLLESSMKQFGFGKKLTVVNDAIGGLRSGSPDGYGVSVILGTGAAVGARGYNGRVWHGSFWMRSTGSSDLIEEMFQAVIRAELGIAEATSLTPRILQIFQVETVEQFLHSITKRGTKANVKKAPLISILIDEAVNGDQVAEKL